jgi:hypothetical protein
VDPLVPEQQGGRVSLTRGFEGLEWAHDVRWPERERIEARRIAART